MSDDCACCSTQTICAVFIALLVLWRAYATYRAKRPLSHFPGRVVLITGASSGIGREMARQLAALGARKGGIRLALAARSQAGLEETAALCKGDGVDVLLVPTDVSARAACKAMIDRVVTRWGRIDDLFLNAGISMCTAIESVTEEGMDLFEKLIEVNYYGVVYPSVYALKHMDHGSTLTLVSSVAGQVGVPFRSGYSASKMAAQGFVHALRAETKGRVSVTIACPGWVETNIRASRLVGSGGTDGAKPLDEEGKKKTKVMEVDECASLILRSTACKDRTLVMKAPIMVYLNPFIPAVVDAFVMRTAAHAAALDGIYIPEFPGLAAESKKTK